MNNFYEEILRNHPRFKDKRIKEFIWKDETNCIIVLEPDLSEIQISISSSL